MGLLDRISRVIRATLTGWVSDAEDPEKILEQAVADMQEDLIQIRQAVAQAIATQKRTERQASQASSTAAEWYNRAQLALQKGDETLAREALSRRQSYAETAQSLEAQITQQRDVVAKLKKNMKALENKLAEARSKKDLYIARARSAKASQQINDMLNQVGTDNAMAAFERMEDKVYQLEAQAEAAEELGTDDLERRFAALEGGDSIDAQLAAMKAEMGGSQSAGELPAAQNQAVDEELEQLRSQIKEQQ
jgi:phage shock protein A